MTPTGLSSARVAPPNDPPEPADLAYATRNHAFAPTTTWILASESLLQADGNGPPREIPLAHVRLLRLDFAPSRPERNRFRCRLLLVNGETLTFFNRTYAGLYNFPETNPEYVTFVEALTTALQRHAPRCEFIAGATIPSYAFNVLMTAFIFACFAAIAWFLFRINLTWLIALKVLILIFYVPTLLRWVVRNRPRRFAPYAIPPDLLPAAPRGSDLRR